MEQEKIIVNNFCLKNFILKNFSQYLQFIFFVKHYYLISGCVKIPSILRFGLLSPIFQKCI